MKNIYALVILSLIGGSSAFAGEMLRSKAKLFHLSAHSSIENPVAVKAAKQVKEMSGTRSFESVKDMEGTYTWTYESHLEGLNGPQTGTVTLSVINEATGECELTGICPWPLKAEALPADGVFAIPCGQHLGSDEDGNVYFYVKVCDENGNLTDGTSTAASSLALIQGETISFMAADYWAVGDPLNENLGYYLLANQNVLKPEEDPNKEVEWTTIGKATLMDGWVLPAYGIDQHDTSNWYEVEIQQCKDNYQIYRLVDPYHGKSPVAKYNESAEVGYIEFDVSDPDHVTFATREAGFANAELGVSEFYPMNTLSYMAGAYASYGFSLSDLIAIFGSDWPFTTYKDGVVHLTTSPDTQFGWLNDAVFGLQGKPYAGQVWLDANDPEPDVNKRASANMETKIFFPGCLMGVETIGAETSDVIEYYNLQGLRITAPAEGELVIEKRGDKCSKVVYK